MEQLLPGSMLLDPYCGLSLGGDGLLLSGRDNIWHNPVFKIATLAQRGTDQWVVDTIFPNATEPCFSTPISPSLLVIGNTDGLKSWKKEGGIWNSTVLENGNCASPLIHLPNDEGDDYVVASINNGLLSVSLTDDSKMILATGDIQGVFSHPNAKLVSAIVNEQRRAWKLTRKTWYELGLVPQEDGLYRSTNDANTIIRQQRPPNYGGSYKPYEIELYDISHQDIRSKEKITVQDITTNYERLIGGLWNGSTMMILSARQQFLDWGGPVYKVDYVYRDFDPKTHTISPMQRIPVGPYWFSRNANTALMIDTFSCLTNGNTPAVRIVTNDPYEPNDSAWSGALIPRTYTYLPTTVNTRS